MLHTWQVVSVPPDQWGTGGETEDGPFITILNTEPSRVAVTQEKTLAAKKSGEFEQN